MFEGKVLFFVSDHQLLQTDIILLINFMLYFTEFDQIKLAVLIAGILDIVNLVERKKPRLQMLSLELIIRLVFVRYCQNSNYVPRSLLRN